MAIKVSSVGYFVKVDDTINTPIYINSKNLIMKFASDRVILSSMFIEKPIEILFTEFEDDIGGTYTTEITISEYLDSLL